MAYRNHCNFITEHEMHEGFYMPTAKLVAYGLRHLETWGNSREGFTLYSVDAKGIGLPISSGPYTLRRDAVAAAKRKFGETVTVGRGRSW